MNIDVGSNKELEQQLESKVSNALSAYERLFEHIKMSNAGDSYMMNNFFDFDINQFDTMMAKVQAYRTFIENQRKDYEARTGHSGAYDKTDKKYWTQASSAMGQITKIQNEIKASNDGSSLENLFGKTDLTEVISGLNQIVVKLDEIVNSAKDLKTAFADGLKIEAATADVTELTNKVKALEEELSKLKSVKSTTSQNTSSSQKNQNPTKGNSQAYNEQIAIIQKLVKARTELNNAERRNKNGSRDKEIADLKTQIAELEPKAKEAEQAIEKMYHPADGSQATITAEQYASALEKIKESATGSAKSVNDLAAAQKAALQAQISGYESDVSRWDKIVHDRETKPETGSQSSTYQNNLTVMKAAYHEMHDLQVKMSEAAKQGIGPSQEDVKRFSELKTKLEGCEQSFKDLTAAQKGSTSLSRDKLFNKIGDYLHKNSGMAKEFKVQLEALQKELTLRGADANVSDLTDKFLKLQIAIREAGQEGRTFLDVVKDKAWYGLAGQIATYFSFQDIVRYASNAARAVIELDDALIDLKKTTTMTGSQLNQFYFDANDVAKQMGVTTKEIIDQASAWSRLGYSSKEASTEMAQLSSQFASISPGMATDDAQNGLVSIMKAWRIDPDQVKSEIMDPINQLGNTMAENNQDIIEGMERSAAALAAVGTSARDSYAIFSAMQEVLQNSEKAGTSLRSVALRLRSFDETTGEVSDDLQNITGELIDLTKTAEHTQGVSIFKPGSTTEFKSLVDYFGEIHDIWDEMSQKQQNDFLLKAFGRTQAQAGAALIQNYSAVTKALEEMDKAAGSSDREMSTVEQSLTYKLNALKETWVGTAQAIGDREGIGNAISGLTSLSEVIQSLVKNFGLVKPLAAGLTAVLSTQNVGRGKMYPLMFEYADNNMCSLGY